MSLAESVISERAVGAGRVAWKLGSLAVSVACFGGGGVAAVLVYPVLALVLHVVLVLVAIVTDGPVGGPLALPFMLLVATVAGIGYTLLAYLAVGLSSLLVSWFRRRVLMFVMVSAVLLAVALVAGTMVLEARDPTLSTTEALSWSVGIAAGGVPAWLVIAAIWFGLRAVGGAVRWAENLAARRYRATTMPAARAGSGDWA